MYVLYHSSKVCEHRLTLPSNFHFTLYQNLGAAGVAADAPEATQRAAMLAAAKSHFAPEFLNRRFNHARLVPIKICLAFANKHSLFYLFASCLTRSRRLCRVRWPVTQRRSFVLSALCARKSRDQFATLFLQVLMNPSCPMACDAKTCLHSCTLQCLC
jgi:hypothetical protein